MASTGRTKQESGTASSTPPASKAAAMAVSSPPGTSVAATTSPSILPLASSRARMYRTTGESKWVTREIAALDFLLGIPMEKENALVQAGYQQQQEREKRERNSIGLGDHHEERSHVDEEKVEEGERKPDETLEPPTPSSATSMSWWDKLINKRDLERPQEQEQSASPQTMESHAHETATAATVSQHHHLPTAPGRRLDGRDAVRVQIPLSFGSVKTRHKSIAKQAAIREWELKLNGHEPALLDGRVFFSNKGSYPIGIYSVLKYEPKKEEAARRRQKLEARGGGGTQFVIPERDWRGTSYRALLPRVEKRNGAFNRYLRRNRKQIRDMVQSGEETPEKKGNDAESHGHDSNDDVDDDMSSSSGESDAYVPGFLDDPEMRQGRHRHVMIGDRVTGALVSSTIQFVKPADLKADLNKQFRERFDGWEPPKSQRKWIGARVVDGVYTLMDPVETAESEDRFLENERPSIRQRQSSISSSQSGDNAKETIRMPPSLTLSKIRSVKAQSLLAVVKADLEISTLALACVYFERLCLDCRVDKSNRRLSFAACLLLAAKINESHVALVMQSRDGGGEDSTDKKARFKSLIRPTKKSSTIFASLLEFFAHDWSLSLKTLFAAEWGVFAALGFQLHATPSQVAFHFKSFMKVLCWGPLAYLGPDQYNQWQDCLLEEAVQREERKKRRERRRERQERKLLKLQRELHRQQEQESLRTNKRPETSEEAEWKLREDSGELPSVASEHSPSASRHERTKKGPMKLLNRFSLKRQHPSMPAMDRLLDRKSIASSTSEPRANKSQLVRSPSMPLVAVSESETNPIHVALDMNVAEGSGDMLSDGGGINV